MTQQVFIIPLTNTPQRFEIELVEKLYIMIVRWNPQTDSWILDLLESQTNITIISSLPLVTGGDLTAQFKHLNIGGSFVVVTDGDEFSIPTLDTLGVSSNLYFVTDR